MADAESQEKRKPSKHYPKTKHLRSLFWPLKRKED